MSSSSESFNPYLGYVGGSIFLFTVVNYLSQYALPSSMACALPSARWKFKNIATSLVHALISGLLGLALFFIHLDLFFSDPISGFHVSLHILVSGSMGYFVYDFLDMFLYQRHHRSTKELLLHHICVILCLYVAASSPNFLPFTCLGLLIEINSIFLHARQLLLMSGVSRVDWKFRVISTCNLITLIFFRILLVTAMLVYVVVEKEELPTLFVITAVFGLSVVGVMNVFLCYRVIKSDYCRNSDEQNKDETSQHGRPRMTLQSTHHGDSGSFFDDDDDDQDEGQDIKKKD